MESYGKKYIYKNTSLPPYSKHKSTINECQNGDEVVLYNNKIRHHNNNNNILSNESSNISNYDIVDGLLKKKTSLTPNHKIKIYHIKNITKEQNNINNNIQQLKHSNSISEGKENDMTTEGSSFHKVQNQSSYENDCNGTLMHLVNVQLQNIDNNNNNANNNNNNNINVSTLEIKQSLPKILYNKKIRHERPYFNKIKEPQLITRNKQDNENEMENILNNTQFKPKTKKEHLQCFGSTVQKITYNINNKQTNKIGPGSYSLNYNNISEKLKRTLNFTKGFSKALTPSNNIHKIIKYKTKYQHKQPGPGWYNISSSFIKKSFSNYSTFLSSERRFSLTNLSTKNNMRSLYLPEHNYTKDTIQPNKPQYIQYSMNERYLRKTPSTDILNIDYNKIYLQHHYKTKILNDKNNIKNKQNEHKQSYAPFGSYIERFEDPVNKQEIYSDYSPEQYSGDLIKKYQHGHKQFFFRNDYGIVKDFFRNKGTDSPGYMNLDSYFDWHKKSYNTMYINN